MRIRLGGAALLILLVPASVARAQAPPAPPKPAPELKRLAYFEGAWTAEGEQKANPFGPAGRFTSRDTCEWIMDGFVLKCSSEGKDPLGSVKALGLMGWDAENKVYTYYGVDNRGMGIPGTGTVDGKTWTYTSTVKSKDRTIRSRWVIREASPAEYTFKWEMADEKGNWTTLAEGRETKVK
jgi:hypothetical protein